MKTKFSLICCVAVFFSLNITAQNADLNNDTIFRMPKPLKCEIVAITRDKVYYRVNPDNTIFKTDNFSYLKDNPTPNIERFKNDTIAVFDIEGNCGFINIRGEIMIPAIYDNADNFSEGLANVKLGNVWGYIDINGNWVIKPIYESAKPFKNGYARVELGRKWGLINKLGKWIIEPEYARLWEFQILK